MNNAALASLCLYLALAALPRILSPEPFEPSWTFVGVAAAGVGVNLLAAAVVLCCRVADAAETPMASEDVRHFAVADDNPMDFDWDEEMLDTTRIDL